MPHYGNSALSIFNVAQFRKNVKPAANLSMNFVICYLTSNAFVPPTSHVLENAVHNQSDEF